MKLTQKCPKCGKIAKIQSSFNIGEMIQYVYQCGHLELLKRVNASHKISEELNKELVATQTLVRNQLECNKTSFVDETKTSTATTMVDSLVATKQELYASLDAWVCDGGAIKQNGHETWKPSYADWDSFNFNDSSGRCYPYQINGIRFAEGTQLNCLFADAMGIGKTIEALFTLKRNKSIAFPCAIFVKGTTIFQWFTEFHRCVSSNLADCIPVTNRVHLMPGFNCYIISMDMLAKEDIVNKLLQIGIKTVVIDECQNFKNESAARTKGLLRLIADGNIKYKLALSGTPIKNYAHEYFTILNILAPKYFHSWADFKNRWLDCTGKKLNPYKIDEFKDLISKWVIRRERHEVLKDLPDLTRDYQLIEIQDQHIKNSYNRTLDLFANWMEDNKTGIKSTQLLGWLAQLRAITGQAKCKNAIEWICDFMESTDEQLAVGIHHHSVRDTLSLVLKANDIPCLTLSGADSVYAKNDIIRQFTSGSTRLLVINSIAGGVGLNLQTCANALVLERQWNSADEEQFEARFHRDGQRKAVTITYMIAKGTIDEYFHEMVQTKRKILSETGIGQSNELESDIDSLMNLANVVIQHKI